MDFTFRIQSSIGIANLKDPDTSSDKSAQTKPSMSAPSHHFLHAATAIKGSMNSDAAHEKKGTPDSPATARTNNVFMVLGGPTRAV